MKNILIRLSIAIFPLFLTIIFTWMTIEGHLNFGGGEKDIFLSIPLLLWSAAFFLGFILQWIKKTKISRAIAISALISTAFIIIIQVAFVFWQLLK